MSRQLPGLAGEIEAVIGLELTAKLLKERGGTDVSIPLRAKGSALAKIVGQRACAALIREIGPGKIALPCAGFRGRDAERAERKRRAMEMLRAGHSLREVALQCDLAQRTVSNYRDELADDRQGKLPL